jgi:hypothetical protein
VRGDDEREIFLKIVWELKELEGVETLVGSEGKRLL